MKKIYHPRSYQKLYSFGIGVTALIFIAGCAGIPPTEQMAVSKVAVSNASSAGGNEFAPLELKSAMDKMDAAEQAMAEKIICAPDNWPNKHRLTLN